MALITLQLADDRLGNHRFIDTDEDSGFSVKWINPFFCVGVTELAHTQELSVPATENNSKLFNLDNVIIAYGWRRGRQCWLGYSGGEIKGKLYIKDFEKNRYNLLFVYGAELDEILSLPIDNYWQPNNSILIDTPKLENIVTDFGWMNYDELHGNGNFANGANILPVINLGWMMDEAAAAAGYTFKINGTNLSNVSEPQFNPYNYCVNIDRVNSGTEYTLHFSNWAADGVFNVANYQFFDENNVAVTDSAAGFSLQLNQLQGTSPGTYWPCYTFYALRPITITLRQDSGVCCIVNQHLIVGAPDSILPPYIQISATFNLNAGDTMTFVSINDYDAQYHGFNDPTTSINYWMTVIDSMTTANVGDNILLSQNLPEISLLQLAKNYCLMTSSYFVVDAASKIIDIYNINDVIARRFSNGAKFGIESHKKLIRVGRLYRYIEGYSIHNRVRCKSADYVVDNQRFNVDYPCDNDLLDDENIFGEITFNDGNMNSDGEAVFENVEIGSGNQINLKPLVGVFFANLNGGYSYHIQWVENNYGMSAGMAALTTTASSIYITIKEALFEFLKRNPEDLIELGSRQWLIQEATWQDDATELKLVSADDALATAPIQPDYLNFKGNGTIYLASTATVAPNLEYSFDGHNFVKWPHTTAGTTHTFDTLTIDDDVTIYVRGNNERMRYSQFFMTGTIYSDGDIGTLIDGIGGPGVAIETYTFMYLFSGCTSLKTPPRIEAITTSKSCYSNMFRGCTGIEEAPTLHAVDVAETAYNNMFNGCSSLQKVKIYAETLGPDALTYWLYNVNPTGQLTCPQSLVIPSGHYELPTGWTRVNL